MRHLSPEAVDTVLEKRESGEVESIPIKVILLCELYRVISRNQKYLEYLLEEFEDDKTLNHNYKDTELTLSLLEVQIGLGVKYAK